MPHDLLRAGRRSWLLPAVVLAALLAVAAPAAAAAPGLSPAASAAVDVAARASTALDLSPYAGRVVVVDFWATTCPACRASLPWLQKLQARWGERGLTALTVNTDRVRSAAERFVAKEQLDLPVIYDSARELATAYQVRGIPHLLFFGRDGILRGKHVGFGPGLDREIEARVEALLVETADAPRDPGK